jgi:hypothetical protein
MRMLRVLAALALVLFAPVQARAQATFIQRNQVTAFGGTITYDSAVTAASTLFCAIIVNTANEISVTGLTSSPANTWVEDGRIVMPTNGRELTLWRVASAAAGSTTVTIAVSGTLDTQRVLCAEYSSSPALELDRYSEATGSSTAPNSGTTATTTAANELLIGVIGTAFNGTVLTPGAGWTDRTETTGERMNFMERLVTSTGTYDASGTFGASDEWGAIIATYKATSGGGGGTLRRMTTLGVGAQQ